MNNPNNPLNIPTATELFRLDEHVALITGAAKGIGRMAAQVLAKAGARVVLTDRDEPALIETMTEIADAGLTTRAHVMDVTDEQTVIDTFASVANEYGRLDVLVNCAGIAQRMPSEETPLKVWNLILAVNLTGTFLCSREAAKIMLEQRSGSIINLSSIMGHCGGGLYPNPAYHATKGAVVNLTRALATEWGDRGVRVNDIAPTFVHTPLTKNLLADETMKTAIEQRMPLGRIAEVDDLAGAILFLASPASAMMTGHSLAVDGGWLAR